MVAFLALFQLVSLRKMPPPRASRLAARKSLGVNMHDFQVESSPEPQPTASTSTVAPSTALLPRRSGRTSLEANPTLDLVKSNTNKSKLTNKAKSTAQAAKRKSSLNNKRSRKDPEQDSADDEGEEESSFIDASNSHLNPKPATLPPPIKSALKSTIAEKKSRGVAVSPDFPYFY